MEKGQAAGHFAAVITILVWGTTFTSTKILLRDFTPIEILFIRNCIGFAALFLSNPRKLELGNKKREWLFAGAGLCGITLYYLFENIALTYTTAANTGVIVAVSPFFIALLSCVFLKAEKPGPRFYLGFLTAITGIALISINGSTVLRLNPRGDLLAIGAAAVWGFYSILTKKISACGYGTVQTTRRIFGYGIVFMLPALYLLGFRPELRLLLKPVNLMNMLFLGFCASALCFATWNFALKVLGAVKTSVYIYLVPVIGVITSAAVLHEPVTPMMVLGTALTLAGLFLSEFRGSSPKAPDAGKGCK